MDQENELLALQLGNLARRLLDAVQAPGGGSLLERFKRYVEGVEQVVAEEAYDNSPGTAEMEVHVNPEGVVLAFAEPIKNLMLTFDVARRVGTAFLQAADSPPPPRTQN